MNGVRLAALHLAPLMEADRRWILAQLSIPERSAINQQLREALRLAPNRLSEVLEEVSRRSGPSTTKSAGTRTLPSHLNDIEADTLHLFLDKLPPGAVGAIATRSERHWGVHYLEQKEPLTRRRHTQLASIAERRVTPAFLDRIESSIAHHFAVASPALESRFEQVMRDANPSHRTG